MYRRERHRMSIESTTPATMRQSMRPTVERTRPGRAAVRSRGLGPGSSPAGRRGLRHARRPGAENAATSPARCRKIALQPRATGRCHDMPHAHASPDDQSGPARLGAPLAEPHRGTGGDAGRRVARHLAPVGERRSAPRRSRDSRNAAERLPAGRSAYSFSPTPPADPAPPHDFRTVSEPGTLEELQSPVYSSTCGARTIAVNSR